MKRSCLAVLLRMHLVLAAVLGCATAALADPAFNIPGAVKERTQYFNAVHVDRITIETYRGPAKVHVGDTAIRADNLVLRFDNGKLAGLAATGNVVATVLDDPLEPRFELAARSALYSPGAEVRLKGEVHVIEGPRKLGSIDDKGRPITVEDLSIGASNGAGTEMLSWKTDRGMDSMITTWPVSRPLSHSKGNNGRG